MEKVTNVETEGFKKYNRIKVTEIRPYVLGEDLTNISVSENDNPREDLGVIARNPEDHNDQWYINRLYFENNFSKMEEETDEVIVDDREEE